MTGYYKWIGAAAGFYLTNFSFFGAFFGFLIGSFIDNFNRAATFINENPSFRQQRNFHSSQDIFNYYQQQTQRYDFPTMLLVLSAAVMKADERVLKSELEYVKSFLSQQLGNRFTAAHLQTLKTFLNQSQALPLQEICNDIQYRTRPEVRLQLLHYLFGIAQADGSISKNELDVILRISRLMGISATDYQSIQNMFYKNTESDYKVLGISKEATEAEIKKAYRQMVVRYHPDKVAQMGEEYQKGAKEKFLKIQEAYENIKKERGIS